MSPHWVCVHGHFYQPPRENPWLEAIEPQPSAAPYPDWNARITAECYRPNASARIIDGRGEIIQIVDNYERMSFNVGPTLMTYLDRAAPDVHAAIIAADINSRARFDGHGTAMAQAYGHLIMPLANRRDKETQVRWGLADFRYRFGREAEGMWLAECAVDTETLEVLAENNVAFTVLSPHQAARFRPPRGGWHEGPIEPGRAYRCPLPSGKSIDLFFYNGSASQAVAFERLLADGGRFAERLASGAPEGGLGHIATDGETYGHHHRYGDMALAWALWTIERSGGDLRLTNYAEFRAIQPATWDVQLHEPSAWSCAHGVGRWQDDCGCNSGGNGGWRQQWRRPLRDSLNWLRDRSIEIFEREGAALFVDPWAARDAYVDVVLARQDARATHESTAAAVEKFLATHGSGATTKAARQRRLELCEMQRHAMQMFTSCGWFFDDISGIETIQILQYAARCIELAGDPNGALEAEFVNQLSAARSNLPSEGDGRTIWHRRVLSARVDAAQIVAHLAVTSLVDERAATRSYAEKSPVFCYDIDFQERLERRSGKSRMISGLVRVRSQITGQEANLGFAGLHLGEHHVAGGVEIDPEPVAWQALTDTLIKAFSVADIFGAQRALDQHFSPTAADGTKRRTTPVGLGSLLGGGREHLLDRILSGPRRDADEALARVYDDYAPLMRWLVSQSLPVPEALHTATAFTLRRRVLANLTSATPKFAALRAQIDEASHVQVELDTPEIAYAAGDALARMLAELSSTSGANPNIEPDAIETIARAAEAVAKMKSPVDLWPAQNLTWALLRRHRASWHEAAEAGDASASRRQHALLALAHALRVSTR